MWTYLTTLGLEFPLPKALPVSQDCSFLEIKSPQSATHSQVCQVTGFPTYSLAELVYGLHFISN